MASRGGNGGKSGWRDPGKQILEADLEENIDMGIL